MGQSVSSAKLRSRRDWNHCQLSKTKSMTLISPMMKTDETEALDGSSDFISDLPDECLAFIFQFLNPGDRKRCSLVCRRWLLIEGQSRHRLSLNAQADLHSLIPSIFTRFDSVTKLALKCDRRSVSICDEALSLISERCRNLTRLKLRACRDLTDAGMSAFAKNCKGLKKLSCGSCAFGAKGMNAVLNNCPALEELTVKRLRGITDGVASELIGPGVAAASLKTICLKEIYNGQCFGPLIIGSKNLKSLKLFRCSGDWDKLFPHIIEQVTSIIEIHMERIQVSDASLRAVSNCPNLEILHLVKTPECTNVGLGAVAEKCKLLRKLHIDGWKANRIGDLGLIAVVKSCPNLQELVLIGVNPTKISLEMLASNCLNLERLALCGSDTVGDAEISCIAVKCIALKKLCIKNCPVTDHGMDALANGCPNLVKVKVKKCRGVTSEGVDRLRATRGSVIVNLDIGEHLDLSAIDGGVQDNGVEFPPIVATSQIGAPATVSNSMGRSTSLKLLGLLSRRSFVTSTLRRLTSSNGSSRS